MPMATDVEKEESVSLKALLIDALKVWPIMLTINCLQILHVVAQSYMHDILSLSRSQRHAVPSIGEECERDQLDGILGANEEEEDEDDFINELADTVISRIRGALDRVRSFSLLVSAEVDVPCSDPTSRCSSAGTCEEVIGICTLFKHCTTKLCNIFHRTG